MFRTKREQQRDNLWGELTDIMHLAEKLEAFVLPARSLLEEAPEAKVNRTDEEAANKHFDDFLFAIEEVKAIDMHELTKAITKEIHIQEGDE